MNKNKNNYSYYFITCLYKLLSHDLPSPYTFGLKERKKINFAKPRDRHPEDKEVIERFNRYTSNIKCRCGRNIYEHPDMKVGSHFISFRYYGELCPFMLIGERIR